MNSYSRTFADTHRKFNVAFKQWATSPSPESRIRVTAAMTKWARLMDPVIGHERVIEYQNSVLDFMDKNERHQTLASAHSGLQAMDDADMEILKKAEREETEARWRLEAAEDATARALIRAELRDLVGTRENSHMAELQADELIVMYWRVQCPYTKMPAMCAGFEVETGAEMRVLSENWIISTKLFQGSDAREAMDAYAALALEELLTKGYTEQRLRPTSRRSRGC